MPACKALKGKEAAGEAGDAAKAATDIPSLGSHFALSAATAALCVLAAMYFHQSSVADADERNLAEWRQVVAAAEDLDPGML